jgi:hypothetical protein
MALTSPKPTEVKMGKASLTLSDFLTKLYKARCPVCGNVTDYIATSDEVPEVNCGSCLIERLEFVKLQLTLVEAQPEVGGPR